jgi:hypothetical protein
MYGISEHKMINPAHVVSIEYVVNKVVGDDGTQSGSIFIQMVNQPDGKAYEIAGPCDQCEDIVNHLIDIIKKINRDDSDENTDFTIIPGGNIDLN